MWQEGVQSRLATVHSAAAVCAFLTLLAAFFWPEAIEESDRLRVAAKALLISGAGFLLASGLVHLRVAALLSRGDSVRPGVLATMAAANLIVLLAAVAIAIKQPRSAAYLAGLDFLLAALVALPALLILILVLTFWFGRQAASQDSLRAIDWVGVALHNVCAVALLAALWWLDGLPWPVS